MHPQRLSGVRSLLPLICLFQFAFQSASFGEAKPAAGDEVPFKNDSTMIDVSDALRSKQYVHRAVLTTLIKKTSNVEAGHFYLNHLMGYSAVWQTGDTDYTKFSSGLQGLSFGYMTKKGHAAELGLELSAVSNVQIGYRYFYRPEKFSLWGFAGAGAGMELPALSFAEGPPAATLYTGPTQMGFVTLGLLIPVIDVGLKAEARFSFYGLSRIIFTTGVGAIIFL